MEKSYKKSVFIVKYKYNENEASSTVKRVFFSEENAMDYIDEVKREEKYGDALWILSDREVEDYEPCTTEDEIVVREIEAQQAMIISFISESYEHTSGFDFVKMLEDTWAKLELGRIGYEEDEEI